MDDFTSPDWNAAIDVEARIARAPADGWVRGMFFQDLAARAHARAGRATGQDRYVAFKAYPLRDYLRLLVDCAATLHPDVPVREGLRRLGHLAYPTFVTSVVGRVIFAVAGDFVSALRVASQAYRVAVDPGRVEVREIGPGRAVAELRHMWSFADAYQVGVFEGAMEAFGREGEVRLRVHEVERVDLLLEWR